MGDGGGIALLRCVGSIFGCWCRGDGGGRALSSFTFNIGYVYRDVFP
jgi:hypothetical protein